MLRGSTRRMVLSFFPVALAATACLSPVTEDSQGLRVPLPDGGFDLICGDGGVYGIGYEQHPDRVRMRNGAPPVFSVLLLNSGTASPCTHVRGDLRLGAEVDLKPYGNVRVIEGQLALASYPAKPLDFSELSKLKSVSGLSLSNTLGMVASLDGFQLEGIYGGGVFIYFAEGLSDISALRSTNIRGGRLLLKSNHELKSLDGLQGVTHLGSLDISDNRNLSSLGGLSNLKRVEGDVDLRANPRLVGIDEFLSRIEIGGTVYR